MRKDFSGVFVLCLVLFGLLLANFLAFRLQSTLDKCETFEDGSMVCPADTWGSGNAQGYWQRIEE